MNGIIKKLAEQAGMEECKFYGELNNM